MYSSQFWLLCISNFLFCSSFQMMIPELPDYLSNMGGKQYLGLIIALFTFTAGFSRPFSGKITDTIGRVPVMAFGSLVCFLCGFAYPFLTTVYGFLFLRFIHGFSTGTKPTATAAYVVDIIPAERRGEAVGTLGIFTATGMSFGPTIGSFIANNFGMNPMFYTSSVFALLSILILVQMKETLPNKKKFSFKLLKLSKNEIFEKAVFPPFLVNLLLCFSAGAVITLAPDLSKSLGIPNKGLFFTVYTIASLLIRLLASKTSDKYGRVPVLMASSMILVVAMVVLALANTPFLFFTAAILFGLPYGMGSPTITAWTADLSNENNRGKAMATMYIALEAGIGIGAYFSGWIYQGDISKMVWAFYLSAILAMAAVIYMWFYWKKSLKSLVNVDRQLSN